MAESSALLRIAEGPGVDRQRLIDFFSTLGPGGGMFPWESEASECKHFADLGLYCIVPTLEVMTSQLKIWGARSWGDAPTALLSRMVVGLIFKRGSLLLAETVSAASREPGLDASTVTNVTVGLFRMCLERDDPGIPAVAALCCGPSVAPVDHLLSPLSALMADSTNPIYRLAGTIALAGDDNSDSDSRQRARHDLFAVGSEMIPDVLERLDGAPEALAAAAASMALTELVVRSLV